MGDRFVDELSPQLAWCLDLDVGLIGELLEALARWQLTVELDEEVDGLYQRQARRSLASCMPSSTRLELGNG